MTTRITMVEATTSVDTVIKANIKMDELESSGHEIVNMSCSSNGSSFTVLIIYKERCNSV